jgi:predicted metalloprotease
VVITEDGIIRDDLGVVLVPTIIESGGASNVEDLGYRREREYVEERTRLARAPSLE